MEISEIKVSDRTFWHGRTIQQFRNNVVFVKNDKIDDSVDFDKVIFPEEIYQVFKETRLGWSGEYTTIFVFLEEYKNPITKFLYNFFKEEYKRNYKKIINI